MDAVPLHNGASAGLQTGQKKRIDFANRNLGRGHNRDLAVDDFIDNQTTAGQITNQFDQETDIHLVKAEIDKGLIGGRTLIADQDVFSRCTRSHIKSKAIMAEYDQGIAMGVQGTPTFFVNGQQVPATVEDLSKAIDAQLKGATQRL